MGIFGAPITPIMLPLFHFKLHSWTSFMTTQLKPSCCFHKALAMNPFLLPHVTQWQQVPVAAPQKNQKQNLTERKMNDCLKWNPVTLLVNKTLNVITLKVLFLLSSISTWRTRSISDMFLVARMVPRRAYSAARISPSSFLLNLVRAENDWN